MRALLEKLQPLGVILNSTQCRKMARLDAMVVKWNRTAGLTGFRSDEERFDRYFGEALHASVWLPENGRVVDVGTGGGSPALPMAIHHPELEWTLLEPNHKKVIFLQEASKTLGLGNIKVERSRYLDYRAVAPVRVVTTRGLALSKDSIQTIGRWLGPRGQFFILTGERAAQKMVDISDGDWKLKVRERLAPRFQTALVLLERV